MGAMPRLARPYLIVLCAIAALVGLYALAGFVALPHFARPALRDYVAKHYHRELAIADLRFNPFTFVLEAHGIVLPDRDGSRMVALGALRLALEAKSIWRLAPSFAEIRLEQPYVHAVIRPDGILNLADLGTDLAPGPTGPPKPKSGGPFKLYIDRLGIGTGTAVFEDRSRPQPFVAELTPIDFELREFSTTAGSANAYELSAASPEGERLHWAGNFGLEPLTAQGQFELTRLKLATVWRYLKRPLPLEIASGQLAIKGAYTLQPGTAGPDLRLTLPEVSVTDLAVRARQETQNWIELPSLTARDTRVALAPRQVSIGKVSLEGGSVRVWRGAGGEVNLLQLLERAPGAGAGGAPAAPDRRSGVPETAAVEPGADTAAAAQAAWHLAAPDIELRDLHIDAEDRSVEPVVRLAIAPVSLRVRGYESSPDAQLAVELATDIDGKSHLQAKADYVPRSGAASAQGELTGFPLTLLQPYIARRTSMTLLGGSLGARVHVSRDAAGVLSAGGELGVAELRTIDNELRKDFVKWRELTVSGIDYSSKPARLRVASIVANQPYARVIIAPDRTVNVTEILKGPGAHSAMGPAGAAAPARARSAAATTGGKGEPKRAKLCLRAGEGGAAPGSAMAISIGTVRFVDASANYADYWIQPNFAVGIQTLGGSVTGLSSDPKARAKVHLEGKVDRYAPVSITGEINPFSAVAYSDVRLAFRGLELTTMTPYSGHFAGYKIDKGKLSVDLGYRVQDCQLTADQHFVIDQLQLGDKVESPDAVNLPLKLAVALLKDRNGVIDIGLPISGSLDDPQFRLGPLIWKVFVNLLTRAVTAPFALIGSLFGGGEDVNRIDFDPGSAVLDAAARERVLSIARALKERPSLKLDVPMLWSDEADRPRLAARKLEASLQPHAADGAPPLPPEQRFRLLVDAFRAGAGKHAELPAAAQAVAAAKKSKQPPDYPAANDALVQALLPQVEVADADLQALGTRRAHAIEDVLAEQGVEPDRLFAVNAAPRPPTDGRVRVELALK